MTGDSLTPWLILLRDLSAKSALLLLASLALTLGMRRASAAARHLVWLLTFAGLLLLPALSVSLPPRPIAVLPPRPAALLALSLPIATSNFIDAPPDIVPDRLAPPPTPARTLPVPARPPSPPDWSMLLCLLWLLGVALTMFPLIAGRILAVRRIRRCSPVTDSDILALAAEAGRQMNVRHVIALRSGPSVSVPVTFGLLRPVILLPGGAASWPAERLRVALLHEMAHIRRGDWATQTTARLVCALFWHNPLVWPAVRMLRSEAERACDDLVLSSGIPAADYAQHLLAVAAALSGTNHPLPLAVPMAGRGPLESRLCAVLTIQPRRAPSRRLVVQAFLMALVVLVPLAVLRPAARAARRIAPPPTVAPIVLPAPPKAARHFHAPIKAAIAIPPVSSPPFVPTESVPIGASPMKPLTPIKAAVLAALAAGLALPVAKAQSPDPVNALPAASAPSAPLPVSVPLSASVNPISFDVDQGSVRDILAMTFKQEHINYVIEQGVSGTVSVHLNGVPFDKALTTVLEASSLPLEYSVRNGVYYIRPRVSAAGAREVVPAAPRQVQIKFEWVSSATAPNTAPDKGVHSLTIVAEEGRKTQASSRHMWNGVGGEETITVLAHLKPGGVVTLDITEHSETTAHPGETLSNVTQTTVSIKDGETGTVGGLMLGSKPGGPSAERMLFVTPSIIHPAAESPVGTSPAPAPSGDAANPFAPSLLPHMRFVKPDAAKAH